jgi:hypothetical protein
MNDDWGCDYEDSHEYEYEYEYEHDREREREPNTGASSPGR